MARSLLFLALVGLIVAGVVWGLQRLRAGDAAALPARPSPHPVTDEIASERATLAYGPDRGSGVLRLSGSQVVFTADTGRVLVIERLDIVGLTATRDLPDRTLPQEVLAITTGTDTVYFAVRSARAWCQLLT